MDVQSYDGPSQFDLFSELYNIQFVFQDYIFSVIFTSLFPGYQFPWGGIQVIRNAVWGVSFPGKKHYEGVRFNVISITRGGWGSNSQEKIVT